MIRSLVRPIHNRFFAFRPSNQVGSENQNSHDDSSNNDAHLCAEPRLGTLLSVSWLVEEGDCAILLAVSIVAAEVVGEDIEGKEVELEANEVEVDRTENSGTDLKKLNVLFKWSSDVARKVSASEIEVDSTEVLVTDNPEELEILFNWSGGGTWSVSSLGELQSYAHKSFRLGVVQQAHNSNILL